MTADDLVNLGFARQGDDLRAPGGTRTCLVPLENSRCFRLVVALPSGATVTAVVAAVALRVEGAPR